MSRPRQAIPLADAGRFHELMGRTTLVRALLVSGLLALLGGALLAAFGQREERRLNPAGTSGEIVLDVSASIAPDTYRRIQASVAELAASDARYGLVVFSDVAYEALPPGTPAGELTPLVRWFRPSEEPGPGSELALPRSPWSGSFAGGTSISEGLRVARRALLRSEGASRSVLLISDLDDDPTDLPALRAELRAYEREGIELRAIGLDPSIANRRLFARLAPGSVVEGPPPAPADLAEPSAIVAASVAGWLLLCGGALLLGLAVNEHWFARLRWGPEDRPVARP